jgi:sugar phosphate isomerase/epimerase
MAAFEISGFADEIDADFSIQLRGLNELGIKYIEVRGVNKKNISQLTLPEVRDVRQELNRHGIRVSSVGSPIGKIQIHDDFQEHMELVKRIIQTAHELESPFIRIFSFYIPEEKPFSLYRNEVIDRLGAILEAAKGSGVTVLHENEKHIYGDIPERCLDLMESLKEYGIASAFDPANFVQCEAQSYPHAFKLLKPYIRYVHIKDALADGRNVPAGQGEGRIQEVLAELKADGYEGFLSLEPHLANFEGLAALEKDKQDGPVETDGLAKFRLAHNSLLSILKSLQG